MKRACPLEETIENSAVTSAKVLTEEQQNVVQAAVQGQSLFLTGRAGTVRTTCAALSGSVASWGVVGTVSPTHSNCASLVFKLLHFSGKIARAQLHS
jgi:hypothetical protein